MISNYWKVIAIGSVVVFLLSSLGLSACRSGEPQGLVIETKAFEWPDRGLNTLELEALIENVGTSGTFHVIMEVTSKSRTQMEYTPITLDKNKQRYVRMKFILGKDVDYPYSYRVWCDAVKAR